MRVSIWQQWASNHSAAFTVMGKFQTVEDAQRVGGILKDILRQVARWKQQDRESKWQAFLAAHQIQHPTAADEDRFASEYYVDSEPTELEQHLADQYQVAWMQTLDYAHDPALAPQAVMIVDRVVIVDEDLIDEYTWTGFWPFEELMRKFGGEVAIQFEHGGTIQVTLRCTAPDDATATRLLEQVRHQVAISLRGQPYDMIYIEGLDFEGQRMLDYVPGSASRDGLVVTYTYQEWLSGRVFAGLIKYLQANGCAIIDYTLETLETE